MKKANNKITKINLQIKNTNTKINLNIDNT